MHELHELKSRLCEELEEYGSKSELDMGDLEVVDKLAHTIKNLDEIIEAYEEEYSGRRSYDRAYDRSYDRSYDGSYEGSYARGRGPRRDSMGRYSSRRSNRGYSMDNASMVMELKELMKDAPDDRTKQEFQRFITKMEQM